MPTDGMQQVDRDSLRRMLSISRSSSRLQSPEYAIGAVMITYVRTNINLPFRMDACSENLSKEVSLDFTRSMNQILFDKTVLSEPGTFPFVTLPDPLEEKVLETGENESWNITYMYIRMWRSYILHMHTLMNAAGRHSDVPKFPFRKIRDRFRFLSLLTSPEVLSVLENVREECGRVSGMATFHTGVGKHLKLEEFEQTQQQAAAQVSVYAHVYVGVCWLYVLAHDHSLVKNVKVLTCYTLPLKSFWQAFS